MFAKQQKEKNLSKHKSMNSPQERKRQYLLHYLGSERKEKKNQIDHSQFIHELLFFTRVKRRRDKIAYLLQLI